MEDVIFEDLVSTSESGIRISAKLDRGGSVRNVSFRNLTFAWAQLEKKTFLFKKKKFEVEQTYALRTLRRMAPAQVGGCFFWG